MIRPSPFAPYAERRAWLDAGLDDPGDPYGLADKPDWMLPHMVCFDDWRCEAVRRYRLKRARGEV